MIERKRSGFLDVDHSRTHRNKLQNVLPEILIYLFFLIELALIKGRKRTKNKGEGKMKMSKKKTEIAVTLLILLAFIMLYVGVRISVLAFLPACGVWILIGVVYWEKRKADNRPKQTVMLMLLCFSLVLLSTFSTPLVHASIIQGHSEATWVYPVHHLYVVVDTDADTINIIWEGCDVLILPIPALRMPQTPSWQAYDDNGFQAHRNALDNGSLPHTGSDTIEGYTVPVQAWLTVKVSWIYSNGLVWITVPLEVKLYIRYEGTYTLSISASTGGSTIPVPGIYTKTPGEVVSVLADANPWYTFRYWILDGTTVFGNPITVTMDSDHTLQAYFGCGCPILFVWNGTDYACEGLLDIHNPEGIDVIYEHALVTTPQRKNGAYLLRLTEHPQTHSYIDQVKLYAIFEDRTMKELPLIWAWHSEDGNVLPQLLHSDDWKADTLGADLNNGTSQRIDLKFASLSPNLEIIGFVFEIEGNNRIIKR